MSPSITSPTNTDPMLAATTSGSGSSSTSQAASNTDPLANESTFLTLLVSQLQNQDPLDPTDSNQFISQLTGYSQLEQLIDINQNTTTAAASSTGTGTDSTTTQPTSGTTN